MKALQVAANGPALQKQTTTSRSGWVRTSARVKSKVIHKKKPAKPPLTVIPPFSTGLSTTITVPSTATLKKYGLDTAAWVSILESQGWACAVCKAIPKSGRFNTDHFHRRGWKKLVPEKRRQYVRGIICHMCNRYYLGRGITEAKAMNVVLYLRAFAAKLDDLVWKDRASKAVAAWDESRGAK